MALSEVKRRLRKYQRETRQAQEMTPIVADIIRKGRYYDELTIQEQNEVIAYHGTDRDTFEVVNGGIFNNCSLHFKIVRKPPAPRNRKEFIERQNEVTAVFEKLRAEYNSPEAVARREAEERDPLFQAEAERKSREAKERWERFERERKEELNNEQ